MWIRNLPDQFQNKESGINILNFLWNHENIYVMDNHLAAAFCWLQKCGQDEAYNFLHIDQHNDFLYNAPINEYAKILGTSKCSLDEYCSVEHNGLPLMRWDNYIKSTQQLHPNWFNHNVFSTQKSPVDRITQCIIPQMVVDYVDPIDINAELDSLFNEEYHIPYSRYKWIVNLDLDFFFDKECNKLFDDEYIVSLANKFKQNKERIQVLTICLSPECCGKDLIEGWSNAICVLDTFMQALAISESENMSFPQDYK